MAGRPAPATGGGQTGLVVVIDDVGHNDALLVRLLGTGLPLAYAVLPNAAQAPAAVARIKGAGRTLMVHMPMESPLREPDDCRLTLAQTSPLRRSLLERCASPLPAQGMNNHEGSRLTTDVTAMRDVANYLHDRKWFFLDSMTTPDSVAVATMRAAKVPVIANDFFLDNDNDEEAIRRQLHKALERAQRLPTVVIGHLRTKTVRVLVEELTIPRQRGQLREIQDRLPSQSQLQ